MNIDGPKYTGTLLFDLSPVKGDLYDLAPGALKGARGEQPGLDKVLEELARSMPKYGDDADIHPGVYQRVLSATDSIANLREQEIILMKGLEVCRESRGRLENNREDDISAIGTQAEDKAEKGNVPALAAHFEQTIRYKSRIAEKALETRRKNEEAAKAEAAKNKPAAGSGGG